MAVFDKNIRILMLKGEKGEIGDAGDYSTLANKPKINNVTLNGTQSAADLGLVAASEIEGINDDIGELQTLDTTDKGSLVNAINEVNGKTISIEHGGTGGTTTTAARTNLEVFTKTVLFSGAATTDAITLSDSISNYYAIEIFYVNNDYIDASTRFVVTKPSMQVTLVSMTPYEAQDLHTPALSIKSTIVTASGQSITPGYAANTDIRSGGTSNTNTNSNAIYRVLGYGY